MSKIIAHVGTGSLAEHHAYRRVVACKRMLSEMGYDPDTGIFDALRELAALKGNVEAGQTSPNTQKPSASQIADSIDAACFPVGGGFIPPKESWLREWCRQLRLL